ncbi:MAG: sulfite exporter TauE/SafE family protein [Alphaproteobacteria bacterium]|nr:sulfite exporter TauE/SafE family protein [Alphaproteobacteria bacterium]
MEPVSFMENILAVGIAECSAAIDGSEGLLFALFMAGFAGGATHCLGMCGPFVISQVQARLEAVPARDMSEFKRLTGGALLPYHMGRGTTYSILGALAALASKQLMQAPHLDWLAGGLLALAAVFFIGYALRGLGVRLPGAGVGGANREGRLARAWGRMVKPLFQHPTGLRGFVLGVALGFIPCGLVYGALAAAGASGDWLTAVFAMAAFWVGTVPALFGLGLAGGALLGRWPDIARQAAPVLLLINGAFLMYLAFQVLKY